jgi:small GTP-binding protein
MFCLSFACYDFFQLRKQGEQVVKRATIILVGSGTVGKTTLVHRLRDKTFSHDGLTITDGIEMSHIPIGGIDFTVLDFAGQKDYAHTHSIFFKNDAIYLALLMPRSGSSHIDLDNFLQMVNDFAPTAPIILITTRADEVRLSTDEEAILRINHSRIIAVMPVDSKSGTGIEELEHLLTKVALEQPGTTRRVPKLFFNFEDILAKFVAQNIFSLTDKEFLTIGVEQIKLSLDSANLARDLFKMWGLVKVLYNGDVVLNPQKLADVLACVISMKPETLNRIGSAREGLLRHDEESLCAIWGEYDRRLWSCEEGGGTSSFIELLHQSGLAYPLYDPCGKLVGMSLIIAMLPERPDGHPLSDVTEASLYKLFLDPDSTHQGSLKIECTQLPSTFIGQLQVKTRFYAMIGGAWKHGCVLVVKDKIGKDSYAIVYEVGNHLMVLSAGSDNSARSVALLNIISLISERFPTLKINDLALTHNKCRGRTWYRDELLECLLDKGNGGIVTDRKFQISILSLETIITFQSIITEVEKNVVEGAVRTLTRQQSVWGVAEKIRQAEGSDRPPLPDSLLCLETLVAKAEDFKTDDYDVEITKQLQKCIQDLLFLLGLRRPKNGLNSLWILLQKKIERSDEMTLIALPLSPHSEVQKPWVAISEAIISIVENDVVVGGEVITVTQDADELIVLVADLLKRTFSQLGVFLPEGSIIASYRDLSKYEVFIIFMMMIKTAFHNQIVTMIFTRVNFVMQNGYTSLRWTAKC